MARFSGIIRCAFGVSLMAIVAPYAEGYFGAKIDDATIAYLVFRLPIFLWGADRLLSGIKLFTTNHGAV